MFYNKLRAGLVHSGIFQRIGIPRTRLPPAVQFVGDKSFSVVSKHSTEWHCQSLGSSEWALCLILAAITAEMSPKGHHSHAPELGNNVLGLTLQMQLPPGPNSQALCGVQLGGHRNAVTDGFLLPLENVLNTWLISRFPWYHFDS